MFTALYSTPTGWVDTQVRTAHPNDRSLAINARALIMHGTTKRFALWDGVSLRNVPQPWAAQLVEAK